MTNTFTVHLHEAHSKDLAGLIVLEEMIAKEKIPVTVTFGADNVENWKSNPVFYDGVKKLVDLDLVEVAQRGYQNACPIRMHTLRDPHHENKCSSFFNSSVTEEMQRDLIRKG